MPNGHDKNWSRLCAALDGFRQRYGRWPVRVRLHQLSLADLRDHLFSPADFASIESKIDLVMDDAEFVAEDDTGARYDYGNEGYSSGSLEPSAEDWLGVKPKADPLDFEVTVLK